MAKREEIKVRCFISLDGADPVPMETLTPEQREYAGRKMTKSFADGLSMYYSQHPEEYDSFPDLACPAGS